MEILQIPLSAMATFCYVAGDPATRTCAVVDPAFDTDKIISTVNNKGWTITHVINTHCHSDHTAGNHAILSATGAELLIHKTDAPILDKFLNRTFTRILGGRRSPQPDRLLSDSDIILIGNCSLKVIHTPGHTRGSICLYTEGHLITGDTLFVGSIGRTDLSGGSLDQLVESVKKKLYILPGETIVWPGHDYGPDKQSTIQHEIKTNPFIS